MLRQDHVKTPGEDAHPQAKEGGLRRNQYSATLTPGLMAPELWESQSCLCHLFCVVLCYGCPSNTHKYIPEMRLPESFLMSLLGICHPHWIKKNGLHLCVSSFDGKQPHVALLWDEMLGWIQNGENAVHMSKPCLMCCGWHLTLN